jgi:allantoin racemase
MSMAFMDVTPDLKARLGVPVVNPAKAALKLADVLIGAGLRHSKRAYPVPPTIMGCGVRDAAALLLS